MAIVSIAVVSMTGSKYGHSQYSRDCSYGTCHAHAHAHGTWDMHMDMGHGHGHGHGMGMDMDMAWAWTWDMDMAWAWAWYGVGLGGAAVPRERHDALPGRAAAARDQVDVLLRHASLGRRGIYAYMLYAYTYI